MPASLITLTTDFGLRDHFVGVMKGVIREIAPKAEIIDITHEVTPYEITEGAFTLAEAYRYFPKRTVHVAVVDPGVGSDRRPIVASGGGHHFVGPDNGVLSMVLEREKCTVRELTASRYFLKPVSRTFHGRDIFAPVAAHLAKGVAPARFGKKIEDALRMSLAQTHRVGKRVWTANILKIDRFGNLITGLKVDEFPTLAEKPFEIAVGTEKIHLHMTNYAAAPFGTPFVIAGSSGYLEIGYNQDSAAKRLGCGVGAPVELTLF